MKLLLDKGAKVNEAVDFWGSALHRIGHDTTTWGPHAEKIDADRIKREVEIARLLLDQGARLDAKSQYGETPLHQAAEKGQPELVALFLERGANVNARDSRGRTSLSRALQPWDRRPNGRDHACAAEILRKHGGTE